MFASSHIEQCHESYIEAMIDQARRAGGAVEEIDGLVLLLTSKAHPSLNLALPTEIGDVEPSLCLRAARFFSRYGCAYYVSVPRELNEAGAVPPGLKRVTRAAAYYTDAPVRERALSKELTSRLASTEADLRDAVDVIARAFAIYGVPRRAVEDTFPSVESLCRSHILTLLVYHGSEPVGASVGRIHDRIAYIHWTAATRPGFALGAAISAKIIAEVFARGARRAWGQSSAMARAIYARMGLVDFMGYDLLVAAHADDEVELPGATPAT